MSEFLKLKYPLMIQFFGEDDNGDAGDGGDGDVLTFDELLADKDYKAEYDRRVQKAIQTYEKNRKKRDSGTKGESGPEEKEGTEAPPTVNPFIEKYAQAEIKVAMAQNGIDPSKIGRAVRLIDHTKVLDAEGAIDAEKLNTTIADLLKEWPELAPLSDGDSKNFKIGADKNKQKGSEDDLIALAFGNNTK